MIPGAYIILLYIIEKITVFFNNYDINLQQGRATNRLYAHQCIPSNIIIIYSSLLCLLILENEN